MEKKTIVVKPAGNIVGLFCAYCAEQPHIYEVVMGETAAIGALVTKYPELFGITIKKIPEETKTTKQPTLF